MANFFASLDYLRRMDSLSWFSGLVLFGSLQGLILSVIIFLRKQHPGAQFLAGFLLILMYNRLETFSWSSSIWSNILVFDMLPYVFIFALGPCLYFYVRANTKRRCSYNAKNLLALHRIICSATISIEYLFLLLDSKRPARTPGD